MKNSSGTGLTATVPEEIDHWNWGAFLLNWIWGIGNNTLIALLMFIPFVNIVMPFVLGAKGSAWAWQNKQWESVEQFKTVQKKWLNWALIINGLFIALAIGSVFFVISLLKSSEVFKMAVTQLETNTEAVQFLGSPVSTGIPSGNIEISGTSGKANLSFSAQGSHGKATVKVEAVKDEDLWKINRIILEEEGSHRRIDLNR